MGALKEEVLIEPLPVFKVIKDLVVDLDPFFEKYRSMKPYLITGTPAPAKERSQSPEDAGVLADAVRCILCGLLHCLVSREPGQGDGGLCRSRGPGPGLSLSLRFHATKGRRSRIGSSRPDGRGLGVPDLLEMHGGLSQGRSR